MAGQVVPSAIVPTSAPECRTRHRGESRRSPAPAAMDRFAPLQSTRRPAAWQRLLTDGENFGGEVSFLNLPSHHSLTPSGKRHSVGRRSTCEVSFGRRFEGSDLPNYRLPERLLGSDIRQQLRRRHWIDIACGLLEPRLRGLLA